MVIYEGRSKIIWGIINVELNNIMGDGRWIVKNRRIYECK